MYVSKYIYFLSMSYIVKLKVFVTSLLCRIIYLLTCCDYIVSHDDSVACVQVVRI